MTRRLLGIVLGTVGCAILALAVGGPLTGRRLSASVGSDDITVRSVSRDGRIFVSFTLTAGFTDELRDAIRSGLPASITYDVFLRRRSPLWFDRTMAHATVSASVRFDNLTRQHQLSRTIDGRGEEPRVTQDEADVREWLTDFRLLPLFPSAGLQANAEYYVKVGARTRPRVNRFLFWPWEQDAATGYYRFTYVQ